MATLEEIYGKVLADDGEKQAFAQAITTKEGTAAFLAERGCDASPEELVALLKGKAPAPEGGELTDAELEGAAGGAWYDWLVELGLSLASFVVLCG